MTRVWDPLVRLGHWGLVGGVAVAWFTRHGGGKLHEWVGYAVLGVLCVRLVWGVVGSRHARFARFVRSPGHTLAYVRSLLSGHAPRHLGHNPLGSWMIVALIVVAFAAAGSGVLYTTDRFWGVEWVEDLHEALAEALLVLAGIHVAGVLFESLRQRENLVAAMIHGRKRDPSPGDID